MSKIQEIEDLKNEIDYLWIIIETLECYVGDEDRPRIQREIEERRKELKQ
jgi:hypothetical protein